MLKKSIRENEKLWKKISHCKQKIKSLFMWEIFLTFASDFGHSNDQNAAVIMIVMINDDW